jgi:hypothetical protein
MSRLFSANSKNGEIEIIVNTNSFEKLHRVLFTTQKKSSESTTPPQEAGYVVFAKEFVSGYVPLASNQYFLLTQAPFILKYTS